jgi:hypothetical protein
MLSEHGIALIMLFRALTTLSLKLSCLFWPLCSVSSSLRVHRNDGTLRMYDDAAASILLLVTIACGSPRFQ